MLSGAAIGLLVGLTGVGGGSLMTPVLILLFGLHPASAVGADLLYASATKAVGTGVHAAGRTVDWALVRLMALGSVPATLLTLTAMKLTGLGGEKSSHGLSVALGFVLLLTAAALLFRDPLLRLARAPEGRTRRPNATAALTVALGAVLGVLITLTSVGAGALGVTLLVFLYPRMPIARVVGSDIVHAVPLTLIAGVGHWWMGSVDLSLVASLLMGSIPGVIVGGLLAPRTPERVLRPILAAVLVLVGWKLAFK
ncbi:MAG: sulfite exporter TauE/SafE family protein [Caulobacteraceae bacterium]|nr:sulfite exporter TauE/SafE family protein [Caulobacter sp.]